MVKNCVIAAIQRTAAFELIHNDYLAQPQQSQVVKTCHIMCNS